MSEVEFLRVFFVLSISCGEESLDEKPEAQRGIEKGEGRCLISLFYGVWGKRRGDRTCTLGNED
jgi:hypothetical protein